MRSDQLVAYLPHRASFQLLREVRDRLGSSKVVIDGRLSDLNTERPYDVVEIDGSDFSVLATGTSDQSSLLEVSIEKHKRIELLDLARPIAFHSYVVYIGNTGDGGSFQKDPMVRKLLGIVDDPSDPDASVGALVHHKPYPLRAPEYVLVGDRTIFDPGRVGAETFVVEMNDVVIYRVYDAGSSIGDIRLHQRTFRDVFRF